MEEFNNCINNCGLIELNSMGGHLSWCNGQQRHNRKWAKLDRTLVNTQFINHFNLACCEYLFSKTSNHKPIMVLFTCQFKKYGLLPFRNQNILISHDNFNEFMN